MKAILFLSLPALFCSGAMAAPVDKFNITPQEQAACVEDAISFCSATFPDEDKLLACMKVNREKLSTGCSIAFTTGLRKRHLSL
jgi:hypothetical protein